MILITDRDEVAGTFGEAVASATVRLDALRDVDVAYSAIACDVALDSFEAIERVRAALARYRTDAAQPLIFLVRDCDPLAYALANALGATEIVSPQTTPATYAALRGPKIAAANRSFEAEAAPSLETLVEIVSGSLGAMFGAVERQERLSLDSLGRGAEALVAAAKQSCIGEWVGIVRGYDDATYQHCLLVGGLVARFAAHLGLSFKTQHTLAEAALVHDIGKSRVPRAILNKNGPLSPAELDVMRKHPATGYYMIAHQHGLDPVVLDVVRHHHEMLDGSGYPDRLKGEQISGLCRLVTICDIYAALIERRPYKAAMGAAEAYAVLVGMGGKLDVQLVGEFHQIVAEMAASAKAAA